MFRSSLTMPKQAKPNTVHAGVLQPLAADPPAQPRREIELDPVKKAAVLSNISLAEKELKLSDDGEKMKTRRLVEHLQLPCNIELGLVIRVPPAENKQQFSVFCQRCSESVQVWVGCLLLL